MTGEEVRGLIERHRVLYQQRKAAGEGASAEERTLKQAILDGLEIREISRDVALDLLERMMENERVHRPQDAELLRNTRLAARDATLDAPLPTDKHCLGLFIPGSDRPAALVYTALSRTPDDASGAPGNAALTGDIAGLLRHEPQPVTEPNTIIFYSVSNLISDDWLPELAGVPVGNELIRKAARHMRAHHPQITKFSTLSPMRSDMTDARKSQTEFRPWLEENLPRLLLEKETAALSRLCAQCGLAADGPWAQMEALLTYLGHEERRTAGYAEPRIWLHNLLGDMALLYLREGRDWVEGFHMGMLGGYVGGVRVLGTGPEALDMVMVNYVHDEGRVNERAKHFRDDHVLTLAPYLHKRLEQRLEALRAEQKNLAAGMRADAFLLHTADEKNAPALNT